MTSCPLQFAGYFRTRSYVTVWEVEDDCMWLFRFNSAAIHLHLIMSSAVVPHLLLEFLINVWNHSWRDCFMGTMRLCWLTVRCKSTISIANGLWRSQFCFVSMFFAGVTWTGVNLSQTGSGKTYTMGTGYTVGGSTHGVIPQVMEFIFRQIESLKKKADFQIRVSFIEVCVVQGLQLYLIPVLNSLLGVVLQVVDGQVRSRRFSSLVLSKLGRVCNIKCSDGFTLDVRLRCRQSYKSAF